MVAIGLFHCCEKGLLELLLMSFVHLNSKEKYMN